MMALTEFERQGNAARPHGGPDAQGLPRFDFSTNSNACGPNPHALHAIRQADASRYPDPSYRNLRRQLAAFHAVEPDQIVLAASGSAFIFLLTQVLLQAHFLFAYRRTGLVITPARRGPLVVWFATRRKTLT